MSNNNFSAVAHILDEWRATADPSYKAFNTKLKVSNDPDSIIGIRMPITRKTAKELSRLLSASEAIDRLLPIAKTSYEGKLLLGLVIKENFGREEVPMLIDRLYDLCDGWAVPDLYQEVLGEMAVKGMVEEVKHSIAKHKEICNPFARRLSIVAHFPLIKHNLVSPEEALGHVYATEWDTHYYIEMANAWLSAEIKIRYPEMEPRLSNPSLIKRYRQKLRESLRQP
ncbi:MAG: DNA alkylation repair protein [Porphyromonas sp.]|nr:DNA alkylation repair protein [Porphyromonas sp.]